MVGKQDFSGIWTALITPMHQDGAVDFETYRKLIKRQVAGGVQGVVPCGTTGESPTLSEEDRKRLISLALEETKGTATKVLAGTGGNDTSKTVAFSRWASDQGAAGLLVVLPYYNLPTQEGLVKHFSAICDAVECDVMAYLTPKRTGVTLHAETIAMLAKHPRFRAIKDSTGSITSPMETLDRCREAGVTIQMLTGDDINFLPSLSIGSVGVVSVSSNLIPAEMVAIWKAFLSNRREEATKLHQRYYPLFRDLFVETNPAPIKAAMHAEGLCQPTLRLPLCEMQPKSLATLRKVLGEIRER